MKRTCLQSFAFVLAAALCGTAFAQDVLPKPEPPSRAEVVPIVKTSMQSK